jgi:hypothetical protein
MMIGWLVIAIERPFLLILLALGLAAYARNKSLAAKYAIIVFPIIISINYIAMGWSGTDYSRSLRWLADMSYVVTGFIVFLACLTAFTFGINYYLKNKNTVVLILIISFGLYAISSLLIFIDSYCIFFNKDYINPIAGNIRTAASMTGSLTYLVGIAAMIVALVQPKLQPESVNKNGLNIIKRGVNRFGKLGVASIFLMGIGVMIDLLRPLIMWLWHVLSIPVSGMLLEFLGLVLFLISWVLNKKPDKVVFTLLIILTAVHGIPILTYGATALYSLITR